MAGKPKKSGFPSWGQMWRGNLKFQTSAGGGETYTLKGKIFPPQCVVMGVGKDGLQAEPARSLPPPHDEGDEKSWFWTLKQ